MPVFQVGEKRRQRASSERMGLACCWDRRRAIAILREIVSATPVSASPASRWVEGATIRKAADLLEELEPA